MPRGLCMVQYRPGLMQPLPGLMQPLPGPMQPRCRPGRMQPLPGLIQPLGLMQPLSVQIGLPMRL